MRVYTVGHSSREMGELLSLLKNYHIELLADVRSYPKSSRFPYFNRENMERTLSKEGIEYLHMPNLGGFRREGYPSYTGTEEFRRAILELIQLAKDKRTAIMCAEKDWRNCHRRFIAEELARRGVEVIHILDLDRFEEHPRTIF